MREGFAASYIAAGMAALKEKLVQPQFVLAQVGLILPDDSDTIRTAYFQKMFPRASAQFRDERELDAFPDLNVVRFERYAALGPAWRQDSWDRRSTRSPWFRLRDAEGAWRAYISARRS